MVQSNSLVGFFELKQSLLSPHELLAFPREGKLQNLIRVLRVQQLARQLINFIFKELLFPDQSGSPALSLAHLPDSLLKLSILVVKPVAVDLQISYSSLGGVDRMVSRLDQMRAIGEVMRQMKTLSEIPNGRFLRLLLSHLRRGAVLVGNVVMSPIRGSDAVVVLGGESFYLSR